MPLLAVSSLNLKELFGGNMFLLSNIRPKPDPVAKHFPECCTGDDESKKSHEI